MTSSSHKINCVCQLEYNCSIFCENFDSVCWDMSEILDYFHYLLTDPRISFWKRKINLKFFLENLYKATNVYLFVCTNVYLPLTNYLI